jgi:hypothetical protein
MPRLLMVSRTPSLAMGLAGTTFDVEVLSAGEAMRSREELPADVVLLDVQSAEWAALLLAKLRSSADPVPALVLAGPDWDCASLEGLPATSVVVRPVNQKSLVAALNTILTPGAPAAGTSDNGNTVAHAQTPTAAQSDVATSPRPKDPAMAAQEPPARPLGTGPVDLVRALLPHADQLPRMPEVGGSALVQSLAVTSADAGALLVREDDRWVVMASSGLRSLELRAELGPDHWLVATVCLGRRAVLVRDTDVARSHLAGAPLASARYLLAVPVDHLDGILMAARRNGPAFAEEDLLRFAAVGRGASAALAEAAEVHRLAKALARHLDGGAGD